MDLSSRVAAIDDDVFSANKVYSRSSFQRLLRTCNILKVKSASRIQNWLAGLLVAIFY